jgi:hypothetical protein
MREETDMYMITQLREKKEKCTLWDVILLMKETVRTSEIAVYSNKDYTVLHPKRL